MNSHKPAYLTPQQLDEFLSLGWYRIGQQIFTTDIELFEGELYTVQWIRIAVGRVKYDKKRKRLFRINKNFSVRIKPLFITTEIENLFTIYKTSINFVHTNSVVECLFWNADYNIFDTEMIEIRDDGRLIAIGFFDKGQNSIAGILNFYDPEYKSKDLGKYLMLLKINYAIEYGKSWYYLGYISKEYSKFDYKLFPDPNATEVYDREQQKWISFKTFL